MTRVSRKDPEHLVEGESRLRGEMNRVEARLAEAWETLDRRLAEGVSDPLRDVLQGVRDAHREIIEEAGLHREGAPHGGPVPTWSALRRYRDRVAETVVAPLLAVLEEVPPGVRVAGMWQGFMEGIGESGDPLPEEVVRPEAADLFQSSADDSRLTAFRKGWIRGTRRAVGLVRRPLPREQAVPLRDLARDVLRGEALPQVADRAEALQRHYARALAEVERAVGRWVADWFPLEDEAHGPEDHVPEAGAARVEELRDQETPHPEDAPKTDDAPEAEGMPSPEPVPGEGVEQDAPDEGHPHEGHPHDVDAEEPTVPPRTPATVARELQRALDTAGGLPHPAPILSEVRAGLDGLLEELKEAVRTSDSFLSRSPGRRHESRLARRREALQAQARAWPDWYDGVSGRLRLTLELARLRRDLEASLDRLVADALDASILALSRALDREKEELRQLRRGAEAPESALQASGDREAVTEAIRELREMAIASLRDGLDEALDREDMPARITRAADRAAEEIAERLRKLPETVEVRPLREGKLEPQPEQPLRAVRVQELVRQSLDVLHLESLRTSPAPLLAALEEARVQCREIPGVVDYNLGAALDELEHEEDGDPEAVLADARDLTLSGLVRSERGLDQVVAEVVEPWDIFLGAAHGVLHRAMQQVSDRVAVERAVQEQFRDLRTRVRRQVRHLRERLRTWWARTRERLAPVLRRGERLVRRVVQQGRRIMGTEAVREGESERAMEILRTVSGLLEPLPLVYRRLFSFHPLTDPALLAGRDDEIAWVTRRYGAWKDGLRNPALLTGPVTAGHTSLLNVLENTLFRDARVLRLVFDDRPAGFRALAELLAERLQEAEFLTAAEGPWSLDRLAAFLEETPPGREGDPPAVVLVEQLPHLYLRVPGGTALVEGFLEFAARTSQSIFWLATTSEAMWKHIQKAEPRAAALVSRGTVSTLDREEMEAALMSRHKRSGVPLDFAVPGDANPLLRRRLSRAKTDSERYEYLKEEFFDRLYRASQGSISMAILLWLKAADFTAHDGWLVLRAPRPIRFSFLEELDTGLDFALMALLEHGSLTLEEYTRVFNAPADEAYQALEALRGRTLLDRLETQGGLPEPVNRIEDGVRYRVPPMLTQVVAQYLRNQNILH